MTRRLRIAVVGSRGVPATFGGVEHHVEELGRRLVARGHEVTVYARSNYLEDPPAEHLGMRVRTLPTVSAKHMDAIVHSALSTADAMRHGADIVQYHAIGPGLVAFAPRGLTRAKVVLTVHGRDGERAKWGRGAKTVLSGAEWLSARVPDATVVVSHDLQRHYREAYGRDAVYISNGVERPAPAPAAEITERWGLERDSYLLFVGRLVPEKAPDLLVRAFRRLAGDRRLVIVGGSSYTDDYVRGLERAAAGDNRVVLPGYVFGQAKDELYANAAAFVNPSMLEGLPLTVLEAIAAGTPVVVSDIPPHLEVVQGEAPGRRVFAAGNEDELLAALNRSLDAGPGERSAAEGFAGDLLARYDWDQAADATEQLYLRLTERR